MNIRVEHTNLVEIAQPNSKTEIKGSVSTETQGASSQGSVQETGSVSSVQQTVVDAPFFPEESQIEKIQQAASQQEAQLLKRDLEVVSNTMSERDCGLLEEDGFSAGSTEVEAIVTEMDKIKMELAKAGVDISIFGDKLSGDQLKEIAGNPGLANQLASAIKQADLPVSEELTTGCAEALQEAASLTECNREAAKYLLERELPPTIENLYLAQHSAKGAVPAASGGMALEGNLKAQVEQVIVQSGHPVNEDTLSASQWMMEQQIPLTPENLGYLLDLEQMQFPLDADQVANAMFEAVAEGGRPADAIILEGYRNTDRAKQAEQVVKQATDAQVWSVVEKGLPLTIEHLMAAQQEGDAGQEASYRNGAQHGQAADPGLELSFVTAKRQLEEARLVMTAQANYALLKQGISIETRPLESLVEELKALEENYYKALLSQNGVPATEENTAVFAGTLESVDALAKAPAYILGEIQTDRESIAQARDVGSARQAELARAGEAYETLKTEPRADLGDSIQKAFGNVDDILSDLGLEATGQNRRAVRILAYNQLEITEASIAQMKGADQKVQNLFQNLTPAVALEMIREGTNPLELTVEQLNAKAEEMKLRLDPDGGEKFSKFLWKLEQRQGITPEERDSFIGIYRLLNQIDKTDGAVIGALVHQGAELSMKNLLSAVRTRQGQGIRASVDDTFGAVEEVRTQNLSISEQIEAAYQTDCAKESFARATPEGMQQAQAQGSMLEMTPEELLRQLQDSAPDEALEEAYYKEKIQMFSQAKESEAQVLQTLGRYDMPATAYNIIAANQMAQSRNVFKSLFAPGSTDGETSLEDAKKQLLEDFAEAVKTPEEMAKAQEKLADLAENVMKTMIQSEDVRSLEIRDMKILQQQIELGARMAKEEHYAIPVLVADEVTNVQLKIVRGKRERGRVEVMFDAPKYGKAAASFQVQGDSVKGYIAAESKEAIEALKAREDSLRARLGREEGTGWEVQYLHTQDLDLERFGSGRPMAAEEQEKDTEAYQVQTKELYGMAKAFLEEVKSMDDQRGAQHEN